MIEKAKVCGGEVGRWDSHVCLEMPTVHLNGSYMNKNKVKRQGQGESHMV